MYRYFALPKDAVCGTGEIRRDATERFFGLVKQVAGLDRSVAAPMIHSGQKIETDQFIIWAEPINPFKPAKIILFEPRVDCAVHKSR